MEFASNPRRNRWCHLWYKKNWIDNCVSTRLEELSFQRKAFQIEYWFSFVQYFRGSNSCQLILFLCTWSPRCFVKITRLCRKSYFVSVGLKSNSERASSGWNFNNGIGCLIEQRSFISWKKISWSFFQIAFRSKKVILSK